MNKQINLFLLMLAALLFLAVVYKKIFKINEVNDEDITGASTENVASINEKGVMNTKEMRNDQRDMEQNTQPPLCKNQTSVIIFATMRSVVIGQFFEHNRDVENCKLPDKVTTCLYTNDRKYYNTADVLYVRVCFTKLHKRAYPEQLVLSYNRARETNGCNHPNYVMKIADVRVSYPLSSTIPFPYMCWPHIQQPLLNVLKLKPPSDRNGIVMFISNCGSAWRYNYIKELMEYIHIDSYGECLHNTNMSSTRGMGSEDFLSIKIDLIKSKQYKFLISFENSVVQEYVTEKIWHAYLSQTIPIYYGASEVYQQVPGNHTFIDAAKFAGPKDLAQYIMEVDANESLYKSYFKFDTRQTLHFQKHCPSEPLGCTMCKHLYHLKEQRCSWT